MGESKTYRVHEVLLNIAAAPLTPEPVSNPAATYLLSHPRSQYGPQPRRARMGMFDDIRCEHPLPAPKANGIGFQTKDFQCDMDELLIKADGTLWRTASSWASNPLGHMSDYFGEVRFYTCGPYRAPWWLEFRARFVDGKLYGPIVLVQDTRPAKTLTLAATPE